MPSVWAFFHSVTPAKLALFHDIPEPSASGIGFFAHPLETDDNLMIEVKGVYAAGDGPGVAKADSDAIRRGDVSREERPMLRLMCCILFCCSILGPVPAWGEGIDLERYITRCRKHTGPRVIREGKSCPKETRIQLCTHMSQALSRSYASQFDCNTTCRGQFESGKHQFPSNCSPWLENAELQCKRMCGRM